jgi:hypothetical protein
MRKTFTFIASNVIDNRWKTIEVKASNEQNAERIALFAAIAVEGFRPAGTAVVLVPNFN